MEKHVTILGALYIAFSIMGLLAAFIVFVVIAGGGMISGDDEAIAITMIVASVVAIILIVTAVPGIIEDKCGEESRYKTSLLFHE